MTLLFAEEKTKTHTIKIFACDVIDICNKSCIRIAAETSAKYIKLILLCNSLQRCFIVTKLSITSIKCTIKTFQNRMRHF